MMEGIDRVTRKEDLKTRDRAAVKGVLVGLIAAFGVGLVIGPSALGDVWKYDWQNKKRKIKVWYRATEPQDFKDDVDAAMAKWNEKATGWTFNAGTESDHNVEVKQGQTPGANGKCVTSLSNGERTGSVITINKNGTSGPRQRTLEHELGHTMRLKDVKDDGNDGGDIMEGSQGASDTNLQPTANDIKEAKDGAQTNKKKAKNAPKSTTEDQATDVTITPVEGEAFELFRAESVNVVPIDPETLFIDTEMLQWSPEADVILVPMSPQPGAIHNEWYSVIVMYGQTEEAHFDGVLLVTEEPPPPQQLPHAVVPEEVTGMEGELIAVDGAESYHDAGAYMTFVWLIDGEEGVLFGGPIGHFEFSAGEHTVTLLVEDQWGETDTATTQVHVLGDPIPTVSEWALIVMTLLALTVGTVVFGRRRRPTLV